MINKNNNVNVIYLLGTGRSGTTIMATVFNEHPNIHTVGEMHQFLEHVVLSKRCSCGEKLTECTFWSSIVRQLNLTEEQLKNALELSSNMEQHHNIPKLLLKGKVDNRYVRIQEEIFKLIAKDNPNKHFLDSSKYIARYLSLKRNKSMNVKGIYVVRDVRGVINSFQKKVQTPRNPISTIIYYLAVNVFGELVCRMDKDVIKVKYEDFIEDPDNTFMKIHNHCFNISDSHLKPITSISEFEMPHIIGGNRMKVNKTIVLKKDEKWKEVIPRTYQIIYYIMTLPFMLINKYKI